MSIDSDKIVNIAQSTRMSDEQKLGGIIEELVKGCGDSVTTVLIKAMAVKEQKIKEDRLELRKAIEQSVGVISKVSRDLLDNKTAHKAKNFLNYIFSSEGVPYLTPLFYTRNPEGVNHQADSVNGKWLFDKYSDSVIQSGDSLDEWAKTFGYSKYLKKITENNK